ncbi:NAD(+) diphosphatase [Prevotella sp. E13-17]|uniref:NAD(+) diphosphatase n=1 Tax=Prevotella sp. E13-17 TaxID=2913616 RepID=UPI001EDA7D64|nr:NAD(+) diphosphatase [Prevotella sp. E13-17]UKK51912.1 NAD(+) diphosphatase [Prevotella sp. E13-17]
MRYYYFVFCKDDIMLEKKADGTYTIPYQEEPPIALKPWTTLLNVSALGNAEVKAYTIDTPVFDNDKYEMCPLRQSYYKLPEALYLKAGKCAELIYWDKNTKFCGVCGGHMHFHTDISKRCEMCGKEIWPQLSPAVIVLIHRDADTVLLARGRSFRRDFYGLIAGFVETGETLEEAVQREVMEETGLSIKNLRYFGSQPWPYPCGIMVGFHADYAGGELHLQREEISKAAWFHRDNLPNLPEKLSIARRLIDDWINTPTDS